MRSAALRNCTHPLAAPITIEICDSYFTRLKGYMFARRIGQDKGRALVQGKSSRLDAAIHMLFVGFDLGIIWLDDNLKVVDRVHAHSWALFYQPRVPARLLLEIHPARLDEFKPGDTLAIDYL